MKRKERLLREKEERIIIDTIRTIKSLPKAMKRINVMIPRYFEYLASVLREKNRRYFQATIERGLP